MIWPEEWCRKVIKGPYKTLERKWLICILGLMIPGIAISAAIFWTNILGLVVINHHDSRIDGWYTNFGLTLRKQEAFTVIS